MSGLTPEGGREVSQRYAIVMDAMAFNLPAPARLEKLARHAKSLGFICVLVERIDAITGRRRSMPEIYLPGKMQPGKASRP